MTLRLENLTKRRKRGAASAHVLDEVSTTVERGTMLALYGPSGSGKTTLLRLVAGLDKPSSGAVIFNGRRIDALSDRELTSYWRHDIGCVWHNQSPIPGLTVREHLAERAQLVCASRRESLTVADSFLDLLMIRDLAEAHVTELSRGEWSCVSIAQALVTKPRLVLADEPAVHLDPNGRDQVMLLLRQLADEAEVTSIVSATHALEVVHAHSVLALEGGRVYNHAEASAEHSQESSAAIVELPVTRSR